MTRGALVLATAIALGAVVSAPSATLACDVCNLKLTHRTGPYRIVVTKEGEPVLKKAPQLRITIINPGPSPLVLGDLPRTRVVLNAITPNARAMSPLDVGARGHTKTIAPRSRVTLHARTQFALDRAGVYRFNVSYGLVDSNIITYTVTRQGE